MPETTMQMMPETTMQAADMSEYEKKRAENLKRNQEIMRILGLDQTDFRLHAAHKSGKSGGKQQAATAPSSSRKRKLEEDAETKATPVRRSSRQKGLSASDDSGGDALPYDAESDDVGVQSKERKEMRGSLEEHAEVEAEHLRWAGKQGKQTIVGTASYKHTLHRVMTMDEAALARRIKAIERARGQFAVVKMRLFARVLCLEGYDDLSADAAAALDRLIAVLGEPEGEEDVQEAVEC